MQIPILIEPLTGGRFLARAGEPFAASAEADSPDEARGQLELVLRQRLQNGSQLATLILGNGKTPAEPELLKLDPLPDDDWFFQTMREAISENRRQAERANP